MRSGKGPWSERPRGSSFITAKFALDLVMGALLPSLAPSWVRPIVDAAGKQRAGEKGQDVHFLDSGHLPLLRAQLLSWLLLQSSSCWVQLPHELDHPLFISLPMVVSSASPQSPFWVCQHPMVHSLRVLCSEWEDRGGARRLLQEPRPKRWWWLASRWWQSRKRKLQDDSKTFDLGAFHRTLYPHSPHIA